MKIVPLFEISEHHFESWIEEIEKIGIILTRDGEDKESSEAIHRFWVAKVDQVDAFWLENAVEHNSKRSLVYIGPPLNKRFNDLHQQATLKLVQAGARRLDGI